MCNGLRFRVYERQRSGEPLVRVRLEDMLAHCAKPSVALVLFGEEHGHPVSRGLEESVYAGMLSANPQAGNTTTLSLEMLDTELQEAADDYITQADDCSSEESLFGGRWDNWTDYAQLCNLARGQGAHILAANAPRRFTSLVATMGYEYLAATISDSDRLLIAPLPFQGPSPMLSAKLGPMFRGCGGRSDEEHRGNMLMAQSLWDATMAHRIQRELSRLNGSEKVQGSGERDWPQRVMHICGRYHVEHFLGIVTHLVHYEQEARLNNGNRADCPSAAESEPEIGLASDDSAVSLETIEADIRRQLCLIVCICTSEQEMHKSDAALSENSYLAYAGDFVILCEPRKTAT